MADWDDLLVGVVDHRLRRVHRLIEAACQLCRRGWAEGYWERGVEARRPSAMARCDEAEGGTVYVRVSRTHWEPLACLSTDVLGSLGRLTWHPVDPKHPLELLAECAE